jgi:hypothetical protein
MSRVRSLATVPHVELRLFLTAWLIFAVHFATNIVREHYPAFSLVAHGSLRVDDYLGFHPDIFLHSDGHCYINNNVAASILAAVPLAVFEPFLAHLEAWEKARLAARGPTAWVYRTKYPMRRAFYALAGSQGLQLRLGASAAVTAVLFMAPGSALLVLCMRRVLLARGMTPAAALGLAVLFGFGTPICFRTAQLNHNLLLTYCVFPAFCLLWLPHGPAWQMAVRLLVAGLLCGLGVALDYSGVVPYLCLLGYLAGTRFAAGVRSVAAQASLFLLGSVPGLALLLGTQWWMFGHPLLPAQYWMRPASYTDEGWRGLSWPAPDLLVDNLFHPAFGMYCFAPILLLALVPSRWYQGPLILPVRERRFVALFTILFLLFCSSNQYARMQWNSGFRYLLPLVPFLFLAASDPLMRLPRQCLVGLSAVVLLHSWVLCMFRESVPESWAGLLREGIQLPWLTVLRQTASSETGLLTHRLLPSFVILGCAGVVALVWSVGLQPSSPLPFSSKEPRKTRISRREREGNEGGSSSWLRPPGTSFV